METNDNHKSTREYKVYLHRSKTWVEVTEEQYYAYYRDIWATRKRAQAHGQCMCPKSKTWMCDGDCPICEFSGAGDMRSLDALNPDGNSGMYDYLPDTAPNMEDIITDRMLLDQLIQRLRELDPDADHIIQMLGEEMSDRAIAEKLGRKQRTFADQMKRYRTELRKIRGY